MRFLLAKKRYNLDQDRQKQAHQTIEITNYQPTKRVENDGLIEQRVDMQDIMNYE